MLEKGAIITDHMAKAMAARLHKATEGTERAETVLQKITEATVKETLTTHRTTAPSKGKETTITKTDDSHMLIKTRETMMATKSTKEVTRLLTSLKTVSGMMWTTRPKNLN